MPTSRAASRSGEGVTRLEIETADDDEGDGIFNSNSLSKTSDLFSFGTISRRHKWWVVALVIVLPAGIFLTIANSGGPSTSAQTGQSKIVYDPMKFSEEFEQHKNGKQIYDPDLRPDDPIQKEEPKDPGRFYNDHQVHNPGTPFTRTPNTPPAYEDDMTSTCLERIMHSREGENWQSFLNDFDNMSNLQLCSNPDFPPIAKKKCTCPNPMKPVARTERKYQDVIKHNREKLLAALPDLDMIMVGDSIMEFWQDGSYLGEPLAQFRQNTEVFKEKFGNRVIANGISGDRTTNLAYRLLNGEMPNDVNPKVWWILIGTNDWGVKGCHAHAIAGGVLHVVQIIRKASPDAPIVINAILPRGKEPMETSESWKIISKANRYLACYVHDHAQTMNLRFVNDTDLFLKESEGKTIIEHNLMEDYLHPSAGGYTSWANRILDMLNDVLKEGS